MRRANGTGSVYKRNDTTRRRKPWVAVINLGMNDKGVRKKKIIGSFRTHKEAQSALDLYNASPTDRVIKKITWKQIWERVLAERNRLNKPISIATLNAWKNHSSKIQTLTPQETKTMHLQALIDSTDSAAVQRAMLTTYHMIYDYALANDLAIKNYSKFVKVKQFKKSTLHKPFTSEVMQQLWNDTHQDIVKIILIYTYTGMRSNELSKMEIKNVDIVKRIMIGGSKTTAGKNRVIPIAKCILPFVKYFLHIALFKKSKFLIVPNLSRGIYKLKGMFYARKSFEKYFNGKHLPHDSRHTFITLCDNYEISEKIQKLIVGHSGTDNVTKDVYTHKTIPQLIAAVDSLPYGNDMQMTPRGSHVVATQKKSIQT